jgi:hypothetical protein
MWRTATMSLSRLLTVPALLVLLCAGGLAYAEGPSGDRIPRYVEVTADGAIIIQGDRAWDNPDGCADPFRVYIPASNVHLNQYYAAVLTAIAGGDNVWAWLAGCELMGWGEEYPIVKNLAIRVR